MSAQVTRCPHCHTSFRVREEHLQIADGAVRCGSCLQVFNARDYFITEAVTETATQEAPETTESVVQSNNSDAAAPETEPQVSTPRRSAITFMPDVDDEPAPQRPHTAPRFTLVDDPEPSDTDMSEPDMPAPAPEPEIPQAEPEEIPASEPPLEVPVAEPEPELPEPELPEPELPPEVPASEPEPELPVPEPETELPEPELPQPEIPVSEPKPASDDVPPISFEKRAEHKRAVASQIADLDDDDDFDIDFDFDGELLISDDGIVPVRKTDAEISDAPADPLEPVSELEFGDDDTDETDDDLLPVVETIEDTEAPSDQFGDIEEISLSALPAEEADTISPEEEPVLQLLDVQEPEPSLPENIPEEDSGSTSEEAIGIDEMADEHTNIDIAAASDAELIADLDTVEEADAGAVTETDIGSDIGADNGNDFPDLLEDAFDAISNDGDASLDELLADVGDEDDDLLIHDDMDGENQDLNELLGSETAAAEDPDDPLTADLSEMVSDDYDDVLSHQDNSDEDGKNNRWALDLLGDEPEVKKPTRYSDDIDGPDLDSFDDLSNAGMSFSDLREQQRERNQMNFNEPASAHVSIPEAGEGHDYIDDYVDDYHDQPQTEGDDSDLVIADAPQEEYDELFGSGLLGNDPAQSAAGENLSFAAGNGLDVPPVAIDPVSLQPPVKRKGRTGLWLLSAIVLLLILAAQFVWLRFEHLARDSAVRPYLTQLCELAGCELPGLQDIRQIRTSNTVFNAHPSIADGLVVDTLLTNMADYPQPYPDVRLEFRDLNDRLVAQRNLAPSEYLAGSVLPGDMMPPGIPVHIAIEVINPGPEAVTRQVRLLSNQ